MAGASFSLVIDSGNGSRRDANIVCMCLLFTSPVSMPLWDVAVRFYDTDSTQKVQGVQRTSDNPEKGVICNEN